MSAYRELRDNRLLFEDTSGPPRAHNIVPCLLCTKPFLMLPFIGTPDQVCPECEVTYKDAARVVCRVCNITICRLVPKVLENGFYIRPKSVLHSNCCNVCKPGLSESSVIEIEEWQRVLRPHKIIVTK